MGTLAQAGGRLCKVGTGGGREEPKPVPGEPSSTKGEEAQTAALGQQTSAKPMLTAAQGGAASRDPLRRGRVGSANPKLQGRPEP